MRRETIIIRCDGNGCQQLAEIDDKSRMPEGWHQIRTPDSEGRIGTAGSGMFDLCSLRCVIAWARGRAEAIGQPLPTRVERPSAVAPCPICDMPVALKGLHTHVTHHHPDEDYAAVRELWDLAAANGTATPAEEPVT